MSEIRVPIRPALARAIGVLTVLGVGLVIVGRPVERPHLQAVDAGVLQPLASPEIPVSDKVTYTAPSSYHTGPTQGPHG